MLFAKTLSLSLSMCPDFCVRVGRAGLRLLPKTPPCDRPARPPHVGRHAGRGCAGIEGMDLCFICGRGKTRTCICVSKGYLCIGKPCSPCLVHGEVEVCCPKKRDLFRAKVGTSFSGQRTSRFELLVRHQRLLYRVPCQSSRGHN